MRHFNLTFKKSYKLRNLKFKKVFNWNQFCCHRKWIRPNTEEIFVFIPLYIGALFFISTVQSLYWEIWEIPCNLCTETGPVIMPYIHKEVIVYIYVYIYRGYWRRFFARGLVSTADDSAVELYLPTTLWHFFQNAASTAQLLKCRLYDGCLVRKILGPVVCNFYWDNQTSI